MMPASEFIARNPRAVCDALEDSIRYAYHAMQADRKNRRTCDVQGWAYKWHNDHAQRHKYLLGFLLSIRRGA